MEAIRECRRCERRNGLIGQTSVLYDDDCMAVCGCFGIHDKKSAGFTSEVSRNSNKPTNTFGEDYEKRYSS